MAADDLWLVLQRKLIWDKPNFHWKLTAVKLFRLQCVKYIVHSKSGRWWLLGTDLPQYFLIFHSIFHFISCNVHYWKAWLEISDWASLRKRLLFHHLLRTFICPFHFDVKHFDSPEHKFSVCRSSVCHVFHTFCCVGEILRLFNHDIFWLWNHFLLFWVHHSWINVIFLIWLHPSLGWTHLLSSVSWKNLGVLYMQMGFTFLTHWPLGGVAMFLKV